jgi:adenylyltransferase/sulfurtransferase
MALSDREIARYARQLLLPGLGEEGQERLKASRVRVVGAGPAGGPALLYLAAAGVGTLWVDDPDEVAEADRAGWLYAPADRGTARARAAVEAVRAASSLVEAAILRAGARPTAVLVCGATQEVSRAVAEEARRLGLPHVVAEAGGDGGAVTVVPVGAPCYACAFRVVHGPAPVPAGAAAVGCLAALEMTLLIIGAGGAGGADEEPRGRRIELAHGEPVARATSRLPGCACGGGAPRG